MIGVGVGVCALLSLRSPPVPKPRSAHAEPETLHGKAHWAVNQWQSDGSTNPKRTTLCKA